jgi:hypothetical protein
MFGTRSQLEQGGFCFNELTTFHFPGEQVGGDGPFKNWRHYTGPLEIIDFRGDEATIKVPDFPTIEVSSVSSYPWWKANARPVRRGEFGEGNTVSAGA